MPCNAWPACTHRLTGVFRVGIPTNQGLFGNFDHKTTISTFFTVKIDPMTYSDPDIKALPLTRVSRYYATRMATEARNETSCAMLTLLYFSLDILEAWEA